MSTISFRATGCNAGDAEGDDLTSDLESFVKGLDKKPATTIRFFDKRDYYCVFGEDARFVALEMRKTSEAMKKGRTGLEYAIVNHKQFEAEVRELLLLRQYRVQMYGKESSGRWQLQYECSPGNLGPLEDILYMSKDNLDSRGLIAISNADLCFAIVYVDTICKTIQIAYFTDDINLCTLESVLVQLSPKEAIMPKNTTLRSQIVEKLFLNQVTTSEVNGKEFFVRSDVKSTIQCLLLPDTNSDQVIRSFDSGDSSFISHVI